MKISNRLVRAARPTPPPPPPKPKPKPVVRHDVDELSTGQGSALRREAAARLGGGSPVEATPAVAPAAKARSDNAAFTEEQIEAITANVQSPDDVVLLAQGVIPGDVGALQAQGIPDEWIDDLPQDVQDELIAEVFQRKPFYFIAPGDDGSLSPDDQEEVSAALAASLESGALSEDDAITAASSLDERGPLLLMHALEGSPDVAEELADALFERDDVPGAQAAAAVHYAQTPGLLEEKLASSGDQATAFIALAEVIDSGALEQVYGRDSALGDALYADLVDSAMTLFTASDPGMLQLLMNDERSDRDFAAADSFFRTVLFDPQAVSALEGAGWTRDEIRAGVEGTLQRFTEDSLRLAGIGTRDVGYSEGSMAVGEQVGRLFGLLETAADSAIEEGRGGSGFDSFTKDVAVGASAAVLAAVVTNPALAAAGGIVLGAAGAQIPAGEDLSFEEAKALLEEDLRGAVDVDLGRNLREELIDALGVLRGATHDDPELNARLSEVVDGIDDGSDDIIDYGD